jgi:hypothetical protein
MYRTSLLFTFTFYNLSPAHLQHRVGLLSKGLQIVHGGTLYGSGGLGGMLRDKGGSRTGKSSENNTLHGYNFHEKMVNL